MRTAHYEATDKLHTFFPDGIPAGMCCLVTESHALFVILRWPAPNGHQHVLSRSCPITGLSPEQIHMHASWIIDWLVDDYRDWVYAHEPEPMGSKLMIAGWGVLALGLSIGKWWGGWQI